MDRGAWRVIVCGVTRVGYDLATKLPPPRRWYKEPHSSTLAWKIPWTEEPGRLQSMGLLRVGND